MLPNFIVIGCMKGGTTSLHRYLAEHPDIWLPGTKEVHFFSRYWNQGVDWYASHFEDAGGAAVGEVSPSYTAIDRFPECAARMAVVLPDARLVYLARDPIDRAVSQYRHGVSERSEHRPFAEALTVDSSYARRSCHALQLDPYLRIFPKEQVLVVASERLRRDREATVREIVAFLGVDPAGSRTVDLDREYHRSEGKLARPQWHPALRPLRRYLKHHPRLRAWVRDLPLGMRRGMARIGTSRPGDSTRALLDAISVEDIPGPVHEMFARDVARLGEIYGLTGLPWADRYTRTQA